MISWIQQTFQHHFRTVFAVLLGVTIISFVVVIGASPGVGRADRRVEAHKFFNVNLASTEDMTRILNEARLSVELQYGFQGVGGEQLQQYAYLRTAGIALADELHVPAPTKTELAEAIQKMRLFTDQNGKFDPKKYSDFRKSIEKNPNLTESDIAKVIGDNLRIEKVQFLVAGPGYSLPTDIRQELEIADTSWTLQVAKIDEKSFAPTINPTDAELTKFYEEKSFLYTIPPQVLVSYVDFVASNYAGAVKVTEPEIRSFFDANPSRFAKAPEAGKKPEVAPKVDFAQVHDDVARALVLERAARLAADAANKFSIAGYDRKLQPGSADFEKLANEYKLKVYQAPAFSADAVPAEFSGNPLAGEEASRLSKDRAVSDPVQTERGYSVLFLRGNLPASTPPFVQVKAKVQSDYIAAERERRFVALGVTLRGELQSRVKQGAAFDKIAAAVAESHGVKCEVTSIPAFTLRQRPKELDTAVIAKLDTLKAKEVSEMTVNEATGLLVYAAERKAPDLTEANPNYAEMRSRIGQSVAANNANAYFHDLISRELGQGATISGE